MSNYDKALTNAAEVIKKQLPSREDASFIPSRHLRNARPCPIVQSGEFSSQKVLSNDGIHRLRTQISYVT